MTGPIDFHNHLIPGVDDGAADESQSADGLRAFVAQGITRIVVTPHIDGSLTLHPDALAARLQEIDAGWERLQRVVAEQFPELDVRRGVEVMLDTPEPNLSEDRLRLDGGRFALVEFPFMSVPPHSARVLEVLVRAGVTPIVAHPERYSGVTPDSPLPAEWRAAGALLQVNAGSIKGRYGPPARHIAFALLERGIVDYVCSDYHARGRPATAGARTILAGMDGAEQADLLMVVNPRRMLAGEAPIPVPPLRASRRSSWSRMLRWLK
ncbi:MAG: CpsB/CapC family capsule biosynthesis tyrosine phosphatase [Gemmatimonadota bacterium]